MVDFRYKSSNSANNDCYGMHAFAIILLGMEQKASVGMTRNREISKHLMILGILAPLFITAMVVIASEVNPDYSHQYHAVSRLGTSSVPNPYIFNISMIIYGFMMCIYAYSIYGQLGRDRKSKIMSLFAALHGVGIMFAGIFNDEPLKAGEPYTVEIVMHTTFAIISYVALLAMMITFNLILRYTPFRRRLLWLTVIAFVVSLPLLGLFVFKAAGPIGLYQRIGYGIALLWVLIVTLRLILFMRKLSKLMMP